MLLSLCLMGNLLAQPATTSGQVAPGRVPVQFVGDYFRATGLYSQYVLKLEETSYVLKSYVDQFSAWSEMGSAELDQHTVILSPSSKRGPRLLLLARWGDRRYLVDEQDLGQFCEEAGHGSEPRVWIWGRWFLHDRDETKPVLRGTVPDVCAPMHASEASRQ